MQWVHKLLCPVNNQGFIDEKVIFQLAYGDLKLPWGTLEDISPAELSWLVEADVNSKKQHYEMVSYAFRVGYVSAQNGKYIPLFEEEKKRQVSKVVTKESKSADLEDLENMFST